jgi:hypothetical protein
VKGVLASVAAAPFLGLAWIVVAAWLYFGNSGEPFGAYGGGYVEPSAGWVVPALLVFLALAVAFDVGIGLLVYRLKRRRRDRQAEPLR